MTANADIVFTAIVGVTRRKKQKAKLHSSSDRTGKSLSLLLPSFKIYGSPAIADHLSESSRFRNVKSASFEDIAG